MPLTLHSLTLSDIATIEAAIDALEADVDTLQTEVSTLETNVRDVANIDMMADDYVMTDDESNSLIIVVGNQGVGKTLFFSSGSDATRTGIQYIVSLLASGNFTVANESGGTTVEMSAGTVVQISSSPTLGGVINTSLYSNINARGRSNGVRTEAAAAGNIDDADKGKLIKSTNAGLTTLTVLSTMVTTDFLCDVFATGAAGVSIVGDGTSVVTGNSTLATGGSCRIYRDGSTQSFNCV